MCRVERVELFWGVGGGRGMGNFRENKIISFHGDYLI